MNFTAVLLIRGHGLTGGGTIKIAHLDYLSEKFFFSREWRAGSDMANGTEKAQKVGEALHRLRNDHEQFLEAYESEWLKKSELTEKAFKP